MSILHTYRLFALSCLIGFVVVSATVIKDLWRRVDFNLTVKIQDKVPTRLDDNLVTIVDLGSMEIQTILLACMLFFLPLRRKTKLLVIIAYVMGLFIVLVGKSGIPQPAPPFLLQRGSIGYSFPSSHVQVAASYPSGHTYRVVFVGALIAAVYGRARQRTILHMCITLIALAFAGLVILGLVVLGKHWVSDIVGGTLIAAALAIGASLWDTNP